MKVIIYSEDPDFKPIELDMDYVFIQNWPEYISNTGLLHIVDAPIMCFYYARLYIDDRWPRAEEIIIRDPRSAYKYAYYVINGKWPEAEEVIKKSPEWACMYATYVIKGKWPEAEEVIKKDPYWWSAYKRI